ncbi:ATP-binding cassette subfamily B protein [Kineococcus radiotolerans]|uniref:ATP-binding cassette subfamily B protein n=1 Tax=Kineococcus radiotolerans TaxID=131568 RepID=A0A7W4XYE5_KINRA|nr:ABC transporter ATP-binding protein [Kineococcus radiotolerans]MBB2902160.1 ATP-binding cassette subfamily B protein [Kineococcus radiotolerans]
MLLPLLREHLRPHRGLLIAVVVLQVLQTAASLYLPRLNAEVIDRGVSTGDTAFIWRTGAVMLGVTLVQVVATITAVWCGARVAMALGRDLRAAVFTHVLALSRAEVSRFGAPSLITRATNDVQQVQVLVLVTCTVIVSAPLLCVGGIVMALREDVGLSWLVVVAVPVLVAVMALIMVRLGPLFGVLQERLDTVNRVLREQLTGLRVVRGFVREDAEEARFARANTDLTDVALRAGRWFAVVFPVVVLVVNLTSAAVVWFGAPRVEAGELQVGSLIAFLSYLVQILTGVMMTTFLAVLGPRAAVSAGRIGEVLDLEPGVRDPDVPVEVPAGAPGGRSLEFRDVTFRYPGADRPVLDRVSLDVRAGRTTAVIGSTGAGKTTLVDLATRLADATSGTVLLDGVDVRSVADADLRRRVGLAPQRPYLFAGTVATNLRFGRPDASDEELWAALRTAQAADFVERMEGGLDAPITQGGTNVSGGQRQRLSIARLLVQAPAVLVFDDAFSALDTATDARLRAALAAARPDAAVLVVAQRVSTIVGADEIVVLEAGRVVGRGRHRELLADCPTYREIVSSQLEVAA